MGQEKRGVLRIERRIENLLDSRKVYLRVLYSRVVAVNENGGERRYQQQCVLFETGILFQITRLQNCRAANITFSIRDTPQDSLNTVLPAEVQIPQKLALVIPTLREAGNLPTLLERIRASLDPLQIQYEVIVVDDDSCDGTAEIVQRASEHDARIRLLIRQQVRGLAGAISHGWSHSDAAVLGVMDADLQHPPELLPELWQAIEAGADVVVASRYARPGSLAQWNRMRHLLSQMAIGMTFPLQRPGIRIQDPMSGYFLLQRRVIEGLSLQPRGFKILLEILVRGAIRSAVEVPFIFGGRQAGKSKASLKVGMEYLMLLLRLSKTRRR